jgi:hypothetical protein
VIGMANSDGADQMRRIGKQLKEFGDKGMKREFSKALTKAAQPLKAELPASARATLPRRGGLAERVAEAQVRITRRANGSVRVTARQQYQIGRMDNPGVVRHPTFKRKGEEGRRVVWVSQKIRPGWFTHPAEAARPDLQKAMLQAATEMAARIETARRGVL